MFLSAKTKGYFVDCTEESLLLARTSAVAPPFVVEAIQECPLGDADVIAGALKILQPKKSGNYLQAVCGIYTPRRVNSATTTSYARLDLDLPNFSASGDGSWFGVADPTAPTGTGNSATSPVLQAGQQATLATSITVGSPGLVSFWWRTASVVNQDTLTFLIDGQPAQLPTTAAFTPAASAVISGATAWQNVAFLVSAGTHTLTSGGSSLYSSILSVNVP